MVPVGGTPAWQPLDRSARRLRLVFGLGWPLGQALSRAEAANTGRRGPGPALSAARREPTLAAVPAAVDDPAPARHKLPGYVLRLAGAYAEIVNGGKKVEPTVIDFFDGAVTAGACETES